MKMARNKIQINDRKRCRAHRIRQDVLPPLVVSTVRSTSGTVEFTNTTPLRKVGTAPSECDLVGITYASYCLIGTKVLYTCTKYAERLRGYYLSNVAKI